MGHWGVKSYENDDASDALDVGFDRVHGGIYDDLMDDRNPLTIEQVQQKLANPRTLEEAVKWLVEEFGEISNDWDDEARLALAGVVVRHVELRIEIPEALRQKAAAWLEGEEIEWDEATLRRLRKQKEIAMLAKKV